MKLSRSDFPEVAISFMQQTHLEEVDMLNALYDLFERAEQGEDVPELVASIEALLEHTHAHFAREEEEMLKLNFPPYPVHKQAHDQFLQDFEAVVVQWRASEDVAPVADFVRQITPAWMQQHISTMDFVTANFFAMHEQQQRG